MLDGVTRVFFSRSSSNPQSCSRGEQVGVFYEVGKPESSVLDGRFWLWGGISIVGVLGLIFTVVGGSMILIRRRGRMRKALLKNGRRIEAQFQLVQQNTGLSVNGCHPFQVVCQWQDPQASQVHVFASENLWFDPSRFIHDKTFQVDLEPDNANHYCVDIFSLSTVA
jgi:hypothetical protein